MKVLFDQGTPAPLRKALIGHEVETAFERGWSTLQNGQLIAAAESAGFEVFVTTDQSLKYQQSLAARTIAIVVLLTTSWPRIERQLPRVVKAVDESAPAGHTEVQIE